MNKVQLKLMFVLLMVMATIFSTRGQQGKVYPDIEVVTLFTDRSLYITGEEVQFSAFIQSESQLQELSMILYAEIILPDGKSVSSGKFPILNQAAYGCLLIPKDVTTGVYYLRVYTKYMRNCGPEEYSYAAIKIVNPLRKDLITGTDTLEFAKEFNDASIASDQFLIEFNTTHEKIIKMREINGVIENINETNIQLPHLITNKFDKLIIGMTNDNQSNRPNIKEVLSFI
ncbi:MAG: hypothetical protein WCM93_02540 [Bacteroidota bacterium]